MTDRMIFNSTRPDGTGRYVTVDDDGAMSAWEVVSAIEQLPKRAYDPPSVRRFKDVRAAVMVDNKMGRAEHQPARERARVWVRAQVDPSPTAPHMRPRPQPIAPSMLDHATRGARAAKIAKRKGSARGRG